MNQKKSVYEKPALTKHGKIKDITLAPPSKVSGPGDGPSLMYPS